MILKQGAKSEGLSAKSRTRNCTVQFALTSLRFALCGIMSFNLGDYLPILLMFVVARDLP